MSGRTLRNLSRARNLVLSVAGFGLLATPGLAQSHTSEGAALGGVTGAILGGIIGHQNDETPEGALIGGAVGAIAGGVLGNAKDQQVARDQYFREQAWQQQRIAAAVSLNDVVTMCRSGVSDTVIIGHMQSQGVQQRLTTHDIIWLHQNGVSERVINAMQTASIGGPAIIAPQTVVVERPRPIIVEQPRPAIVIAPNYGYVRRYPSPPPHFHFEYHLNARGPSHGPHRHH